MSQTLDFTTDLADLEGVHSLQIIGRRDALARAEVLALLPPAVRAAWPGMLKGDPGDSGRTATTWLEGTLQKVTACVLPEVASRHNSPSRAWCYPRLLAAGRNARNAVVAVLDDNTHAFAAACGIARSFPTFSVRSKPTESTVVAMLLGPAGPIGGELQPAVAAVRRAAHLVDSPPDMLGPDAFVTTARAIGAFKGVSVHVLRRHDLEAQGFGGIAAVGRAAVQEPALVVLDWAPQGAADKVCWVGKGITYDTGGLSLKTKTGMPGMKTDMGGAAAVLAAFEAAVALEVPVRLTAVLCIAENAIGPAALRPDDVITMYSGKTVEVNNTDAEGRLVLGDGVAWAVKHREPDVLVDLATLTGAQSMATGKLHASLYCNDEALEAKAVDAGKRSGDLVHPLPFAPELFRKEFASSIADMKNSVKDRANAQSSCAAQFVGNHMGEWAGRWLHVDLAAPAHSGGRGTGFGVGLLLTLIGAGA
ncbi:MAG: leucyl aminopeptidase family protein [Alphaproteobacteria bacterium]|nr:leucyl aminopeptidase family protein [Alphaproteobacteria bacterium]